MAVARAGEKTVPGQVNKLYGAGEHIRYAGGFGKASAFAFFLSRAEG